MVTGRVLNVFFVEVFRISKNKWKAFISNQVLGKCFNSDSYFLHSRSPSHCLKGTTTLSI